MAFPSYVHSVIAADDPAAWPIQSQGMNECGVTAPANALNLLMGRRTFEKTNFIQEAGVFFHRQLGGSPSFVTGWLIQRHGFGTHFGTLKHTDREAVLRNLIDSGIPVCIELGANKLGPFTVYGQHSVVLVGYSDPYQGADGQHYEEYYLVDAQYPPSGDGFGLGTNDVDRDGDGVPEHFPGNRTLDRTAFLNDYPTGIYFPVFPTQAAHDAWFAAHIDTVNRMSMIGPLSEKFLTGSPDQWRA